jgi:hypothetical protein
VVVVQEPLEVAAGTEWAMAVVTAAVMAAESLLARAMAGPASRSELVAGLRSLRREARIALALQPDGSPPRRLGTRIRVVG